MATRPACPFIILPQSDMKFIAAPVRTFARPTQLGPASRIPPRLEGGSGFPLRDFKQQADDFKNGDREYHLKG